MGYINVQRRSQRPPRIIPRFFRYASRTLALGLFVALFACVSQSSVSALTTVPTKVNFQGRLTDASGLIVADGLYNMQFKLYDAASGGTLKWSETRETTNRVQITNGLFSTKLGDVTPMDPAIFASGSLYFEITQATPGTATCSTAACATWESPMSSRTLVAASAYAYNSETLDGLDSASFAQLGSANPFTAAQSITISSVNAFQVKNGSTNMFNVDSTNSILTVGTTDSTGTVLVLDVKNSALDPTGSSATPGAMYYNSNMGKFRCYQVSGWVDCISAGGSATLQDVYDNDITGVADITTSSAAKTLLLKAGATFDAAALFDIQDAGGIRLFTVDSVDDRVYIGDSTADGVGSVLVLDTKNTAGDPTGVDGSMYYNSATKSFKCYGNSLWRDCDFASLRSEWVVQEEFANISTTTLSTGSQGWTGATIGTGGTATKLNVGTYSANYDRFGVLQLSSAATTINTGWNLRLDVTGMTGVPSNMTVEFDFGPVTANAALATNQTTYIGLHNGVANTTAPTDGIYFRYTATTTAGNWDRCVQASCATTGVARTTTANQYQRFKIQTNSTGTSVEFFINEASVGTVSSGLPTQASTDVYGPSITSIASGSAPASVMTWKIDYYQIKRNLTTLR